MPVELSFHGAVDTVTGSCHLLRAGGLNILVDCGLFQGTPELEDKNHDDFGFDPASIDFLLLTHGHLDHCGRIPVLVNKGFRGKIICTGATYDIAKIVLMDSARIQEEDFEQWRKISLRRGQEPRKPLYTSLEALDALKYFGPFAEYEKPVRLNDTAKVKFRDAGHIMGAAFLEMELINQMRIIFSGDLGNRNKPIIKNPSLPMEADVVVVESTYASRNHREVEDSVQELLEVIYDTFSRGGNVLIPSFAIERAQDLLFYLKEFIEQGSLPPCRVFLDSPMAISITNVMRRHPECFDRETAELFRTMDDPFYFPGLQFTRTPESSRQINYMKSGAIIIAGSGMCTGGRIKHHLKHNIWREECSLVFVGYQAKGTLGRKIVDGEKDVRIFGDTYRVNARIHTIGGFSSHADRDILLDWVGHTRGPEQIFLVHGEQDSLLSFKESIRDRGMAKEIHIPRMNERFFL